MQWWRITIYCGIVHLQSEKKSRLLSSNNYQVSIQWHDVFNKPIHCLAHLHPSLYQTLINDYHARISLIFNKCQHFKDFLKHCSENFLFTSLSLPLRFTSASKKSPSLKQKMGHIYWAEEEKKREEEEEKKHSEVSPVSGPCLLPKGLIELAD